MSLKYNVSITTSQANAIINAMVLVAIKPTFRCEKTRHIIKTYQRIKTLIMSTTIAKSIKLVIGVTMQHVKPIRHFINTFSSLQARRIIFTYEGASRCNKQCITPRPFIHSVGDIAADLPFTTIEQQLMQKGMSAIVVK